MYRTRKRGLVTPWIAVALVALAVAFGGAAMSSGNASAGPSNTPSASSSNSAPGLEALPPFQADKGVPGIAPHLNMVPAGASAATIKTDAALPAFTASDASAYVAANHISMAVGSGLTVTKVQFMTDAQATALFNGEDPGLYPSNLVCVVTATGSLQSAISGSMKSYTGAVIVFNARTGNRLMTRLMA